MILLWSAVASAGGGPAGTVVLFNADSVDAAEVAAHYAEARQLPEGHLCPVAGVDPAARSMAWADFDALVRGPLDDCLAALPQPDEITTLVTVRGLPYRVDLPAFTVSLQAALQVGHATDGDLEIAGQGQKTLQGYYAGWVPNPVYVGGSCSGVDLAVDNPYAASYTTACEAAALDGLPPAPERADEAFAQGFVYTGQLFVVGHLDGFDFEDAHALVDRGVAADGAFPDAEWLCMRGADEARGARDPECEYTTRLIGDLGLAGAWVDPFDAALSGREVVAYFTGAADMRGSIDGLTYAPGAIADNLTSYGAYADNFFCDATGAVCPEFENQTSIARFVRAGATGAHGTVEEPLNNSFPGAGALLFYASGYALGESFLLAQPYLYWQNLVLGDPLATPFAERPTVEVPAEVPEGGDLSVTAAHPDGVSEVRLYVDGLRVASSDGGEVAWAHGRAAGEAFEVLAVAVAERVSVDRPGWPVADQKLKADVQGWSTVTVTVGPAAPAEDTGAPAVADETGGCGCVSAPVRVEAWWPALAALAASLRRRAGSVRAPRAARSRPGSDRKPRSRAPPP